MPELEWAVLCEAATVADGKTFIHAAGWDTIYAAQFPVVVHIGLAVRVGFTKNECGRPHGVDIIVQNEDGIHLAEAHGSITPDWPEGYPVHWGSTETVAFTFPILIAEKGLLSIEILVDDVSKQTISFRALEATFGSEDPDGP